MRKQLFTISLAFICLLGHLSSSGQNVGMRTDKSRILIGERVRYDLQVRIPSLGYLIDINLPDTIPHFEIVSQSKFDTVTNNNGYALNQTIEFTSFDSGQWYIPAFTVTIQNDKSFRKFMTDSALVNVGYSVADSTSELRDIKPVMDVEVVDYFWWWVAGAVLLGLLLFYIVWRLIKRRKERPVPILHSELSPYDEAIQELDKLRSEPIDPKYFHSQLSGTIKRYYSRVRQVSLLNKTTGDFLLQLKGEPQETHLISLLANALRTGDAVKFAKYRPGNEDHLSCLDAVKSVIEMIHTNK